MNKIYERGEFTITTDPTKVDITVVSQLLSRSYWAGKRNRDIIEKSVKNSLCFSLYHKDVQIGFARVVTDYITFGYVRDVFIHEDYRNKGLGKWMIGCILEHPDMENIERLMLATKDAQGFYKHHGFEELEKPQAFMERLSIIRV
ncbi:N-acetylglutamate synthase-like GNAT family acetyltransferase [Clostridium tetanomorphum]|uniref:GNAT family N-acetyltransferase n=1 Tax=Clostridium tetanomorphum TaxID=1553 RepID=A0A923EAR6_CLOTT|nr:GNAT family N-acetyltransferase [Clostridium tetanomorphum]KAJ53085.1 acetyltransferase [Clostridium tetanomorphum DSM 665]MBC2398377.1 GNAT family N-acetyltransferase [Clostridium tetanomorphum]MBP1865530.1 N-acetylglutamate synthase-like GNAT family acetyltransferase [Clostridium tetanomorphum]NRS86476.1 N-acetylglutamate synthase-like GNAT family acetyltransferase [Clostridium tetanomorphum]NRZ95495.1 N-acetylglutamate synthase-like GNAT family acetyltransferase [Clostridium tetanomorphu